jgi:alkylation response protein AidB-like acyl-CoA dehydrogenase
VDLLLDADQADLVATVEDYLANELSVATQRKHLRTRSALPASAWTGAGDLGIFSLGLPAADGGADLPVVEEALVFRALGRHLAPVAFVAQLLAARLAAELGDDAQQEALVNGRSIVTVALASDRVAGPRDAEHVLAADPERVALLPASSAAGEPVDCLDPTTELVLADLSAAEPALEVRGPAAEQLHALGTLLTSAMLVGIAEATRDASVGYAKERVQYGRLIGSNQAIKHPCADMATRCEAAASLLFFAALAVRDGRPDAAFQLAAAKRVATAAAYDNSRAHVQIHGGMGVTWEHDAHLFVTRTHVLDHMFGNVRSQQQQVLATAPAVP